MANNDSFTIIKHDSSPVSLVATHGIRIQPERRREHQVALDPPHGCSHYDELP